MGGGGGGRAGGEKGLEGCQMALTHPLEMTRPHTESETHFEVTQPFFPLPKNHLLEQFQEVGIIGEIC